VIAVIYFTNGTDLTRDCRSKREDLQQCTRRFFDRLDNIKILQKRELVRTIIIN